MVGKHLNRMRSAFEVVALLSKGFDYCEKLLIVSLVASLSINYLARLEGNKVPPYYAVDSN